MISAIPMGMQIINNRPPEVGLKQFKESCREAWQPAGHFWHDVFLPMHFQQSAHDRYGYASRTRGYIRRKINRRAKLGTGGVNDLVFTGESEESMRRNIYVQATSVSATLKMIAPWYFGKKIAGHPDLIFEATKMIEPEIAAVNKKYQDAALNRMQNSPTQTQTVTI